MSEGGYRTGPAHRGPSAIRLVWVYPDLLSTYGDRGNLLVLARRFPCVREVRGLGLMIGVEIQSSSGEPAPAFRDRLIDPLKRWKLSYEDFRNRARWSDYETAIEDMMAHTATKAAPWYLIPADNKAYGRIAALRILVDRLGKNVSLEPRPIDPGLLKQAKRALRLSASDIRHASRPGKRKVKLKRNVSES